MADVPKFESPVTGAYPAGESGDLTLVDSSATVKWLVRAFADGPAAARLQATFGSSRRDPAGVLVLGSRPGEWILLGRQKAVAGVVESLNGFGSADFVTALEWTHGRALFRITGRRAPLVLEKVCSLDWSDPMTPDGAVASASVAKVICDIARCDRRGTPSYLIFCDRSFGQYVFDALLDAGREFGLTVVDAAPSFNENHDTGACLTPRRLPGGCQTGAVSD